ncbi:TPA: hypothetical protein I7295_24395 [Vibrio parahaemolyticus]|uniref:phage tail protein n=1 Tax=Vibrio alginolyticus TaxID=663 RepID=UPI001A1EBED7|nr:hypothetical protein [Vibrio alginolyticus]MBS9816545.1 hypothetical protein [Vibrio alginolyticus]HAS6465256.1 hypothetical protein [Vibrio parahaemolyticus]HAS6913561.1 hypothetical protein [Vibrio parahaemolyticus]HAS6923854.1 hypothetical protein [Vibrio parahaemolyticus]
MKEIVIAVLAALGTTLVLSLTGVLNSMFNSMVIPSNTVIAFNGDKCPKGWRDFSQAQGRFIIGAGSGDNLKLKKFGDTGGAEEHTLTITEIPKHTHKGKHAEWGFFEWRGGGSDPFWNKKKTFTEYDSSATGGSQPHNNMPPYIVLRWCEKT